MKFKISHLFFCLVVLLMSCKKDPEPISLPTITTGDASVCGNTVVFDSHIYGSSSSSGILYSTNSNFDFNSGNLVSQGELIDFGLLNLTPNTTYYYKAFATDNYGNNIMGDLENFRTGTAISIKTGDYAYIGYNKYWRYYSYTLSASLKGINEVSEWGIMVSSNSNFNNANKCKFEDSYYTDGTTYIQYWNFKTNNVFYYRAYVHLNNGIWIYGDINELYV